MGDLKLLNMGSGTLFEEDIRSSSFKSTHFDALRQNNSRL